MSFFCGIDVGSLTTKAVIIDESGKVVSFQIQRTGGNSRNAAENAITLACKSVEIERKDIVNVVATGYSRKQIPGIGGIKTEITCHARGIVGELEGVRTLIDIGGQDSKVIRLDGQGRVEDFAMNDKCAAGSGRFLEVIALSLDVSVSELGELACSSDSGLTLSSTCTVFAESEVVSLISEGESVENIAAAMCRAIATRVSGLATRVGIKEKVAMSGGVAKNIGVIAALREILGCEIGVPKEPQIIGAVGAALFAREESGRGEKS
ncbi:MAG: acyl-CoA dehydratase activase [Myxococcota bacterium]